MEALHRFNLDVVIPNRHQIQRLRTDKGGEFIKVAFSKICQTIGVRLEFATTVTPQKIGVTERDGRPLMEKTRCFIRYGRFLKYIWGGGNDANGHIPGQQISTRSFRSKTPYLILHGKDTDYN